MVMVVLSFAGPLPLPLQVSAGTPWSSGDTCTTVPVKKALTTEPVVSTSTAASRRNTKRAGVAEHLAGFGHAGLLVNGPPAYRGLPFESSSDISNPHCTIRYEECKWIVAPRAGRC